MDDLVEILGLVGIVVILAFCLVVASSRRFRNAVINSGLYKKGFALHMNIFSKIHNKAIQKIKQELFSNMKPILDNIQGDILEIGSGTGANFAFFPEGSSVIALDPNPHMEKYLKNNADKFPNITITKVVNGVAEDLTDIQDNSVAIVVCTLTLCSVQDIPKVLQEVKRVLKPVSSRRHAFARIPFIMQYASHNGPFALDIKNIFAPNDSNTIN